MEEFKDTLDEARDLGDKKAEASALYGIGDIYFKEKVYDAADEYWRQCEEVCRDANLFLERGQVLLDLGALSIETGDNDGAREFYLKALKVFKDADSLQGLAKTYDRLGRLALLDEDVNQAMVNYRLGLELCRKHDDKIGAVYYMEQLIPIYKGKAAVRDVEQTYRDLITFSEKLGDFDRMALHLVGLADVYHRIKNPLESVPYLKMAHDLYLKIGKEKEASMIRAELERMDASGGD